MKYEWLTIKEDSFVLSIYVQPGAKSTQVSGEHDGALKIRLAAPPVEGKANAALIAFLAKIFSVAKRDVVLNSGELSRHKIIQINKPSQQEEVVTVLGLLA